MAGADPQRTAGKTVGQRSSAQRAEDPHNGGERDVPVGFGSVEDRNHSDDDPMGESADFGVIEKVKWRILVFDGKTTSWRRFKMEFLMAMRHLRLDSVLSGDKNEVPIADRTISRDRLNAHYANSKVAKHFAVWSLISRLLKTDADKRVFFSTKSPEADWGRVASFHCAETQGAKLLLSRKILSARLQPGKDPAIVIGEIVELLAALDEVGIPVHEEFIWLHFVDNLPLGYEFIKNNLQSSKEPLSRYEYLVLCRIMYGNRVMEVQRRNNFVVGSDNTEIISWGHDGIKLSNQYRVEIVLFCS